MTLIASSSRRTLAALVLSTVGLLTGSASALAAPEAPVTNPATAVTGTTATLNGELNPKSTAMTGYEFTYNTNGTCTEGASTEPGAEATGTEMKVSTEVTQLEGSSEYTFCVVATHLEGELSETTAGAPLTFTTSPEKPVIIEQSASGVTPFQAVLQAVVNPENQKTTSCVFEYGETTAYGTTVACEEPAELEGSFLQGTSAHLTGLTPTTAYHYRVVIKNATGEAIASDGEFTTLTPEDPAITSESASAITATDAKLEAKVIPNFQETEYHFEYATSEEALLESKGVRVAGAPPASPLPAVSEELLAGPADIGGGLTPGTVYFYRDLASNATGTSEGPPQTFTTLAALPVIAAPGTAENTTEAKTALSASINPSGGATSYKFLYLTEAGYEEGLARDPEHPWALAKVSLREGSLAQGHAAVPAELTVEELTPGTTYEFAALARNSAGSTIGPAATFTTPGTPPQPAAAGELAAANPPPSPSPFPIAALAPVIPFASIAQLQAREPKPATAPSPKKLTHKQLLTKALRACSKKPKRKRAACRRTAKRKYR